MREGDETKVNAKEGNPRVESKGGKIRRDMRRRKPTNAERRQQACDPDKEEGSPEAGVKSARKGTRPRPSEAKRVRQRTGLESGRATGTST